jgi:hypothetical protein
MKLIVTLVAFIALAAAGQTPPPLHFSDAQVQSNYEAALARVAVPTPPPRILVPSSPFPTSASFDLSPYSAYAQTNLSAYITTATNRVSTLSHLEFSVVVTNGSLTNARIHPWIMKNGLGTVQIYDARGLIMAYYPEPPYITKPPTRAELAAEPPIDLVLKPGEFYALRYKLGERFFLPTPSGKYRARGALIPSNEVEITVE